MKRWPIIVFIVAGAGVLAARVAGQLPAVEESLRWFDPDRRTAQKAYERMLIDVPAAASLRSVHEKLASEPHVAGTPGDERVIEQLASAYAELGLDVERHEIEVLLAYPEEASLKLVDSRGRGADDDPDASPITRIELPLQEMPLEEDRFTQSDELTWGWNAYSGSGDVTAEIVYANYGTKADFRTLADLGVDVAGKVVLARYGGNFRGFKAKFAQDAGAAALIIYTDPDDSGYRRGPIYPEGGWANATYIQRGSIKTLPYPGDPLTPFVEATPDAERLDPAEIDLPAIPVQPIGWGAAGEIMKRMAGEPLPRPLRSSWQGGLPVPYRLTGGPGLELNVHVQQRREIRPTANVLATLRGSEHPEQLIVVGCHHDAWTFGAGDPNAGSIVVYEIARCFAEAAEQGRRPARSIVFANWAAEEYGIIGSTEWVESRREELLEQAVAYINLDMAAMGPNFRSSAAPLLRTVIADAARAVPHPADPDERDVYDLWTGEGEQPPAFGSLGGGSDHVGFYCHVGVPAASFGAGGSDGVSYHSNYETLAWYQAVVGDSYEPAIMLSRIGAVAVSRLANASIVPLDPRQYAADIRQHLGRIHRRAGEIGVSFDLSRLDEAVGRLERTAIRVVQRVHVGLERGRLAPRQVARLDRIFRQLERSWLYEPGLDGRPWYRSLYAATDPDSGYGAWLLPDLRAAVEAGDEDAAATAVQRCARVVDEIARRLADLGPTGD
ncbi:MAG: M28 family peptidase [Planctomycetota bacterium]|jgi:N-acetylated-alpha-linked acidic dipeptidase